MTVILEFTVSVEITYVTGKFAPKDELVEQVTTALEEANPDSLQGSNDGEYTIDTWDVELIEKPKPVRKPRVKRRQPVKLADAGLHTGLPGRVTVVWRDSPQATSLGVLIYRPEGTIRTYAEGAVDPRIRIDHYASTLDAALEFLRAGDGKHLLVPVPIAKQLGDSTWKFE